MPVESQMVVLRASAPASRARRPAEAARKTVGRMLFLVGAAFVRVKRGDDVELSKENLQEFSTGSRVN